MSLCMLVLALAVPISGKDLGLSQASIRQEPREEYLIRLNENIIKTDIQENDVVQTLSSNFNIQLKRNFHMGDLILLHVTSTDADAESAAMLPEVTYVVRDSMVQAFQQCASQPSPGTWGLDRIDQREILASSDPQNPDAVYTWGERTGDLTNAYIADTGIQITHPDFGNRAVWGYTAEGIPGSDDGNGHGTHCAGTVGSNSYGVAKGVNLIAVKVLNDFGSGSTSSVIDGLNWILNDHQARQNATGEVPRSLASLSLGGGANQAMDDAVRAVIAGGVPVVVVAGGSNTDACLFSPARVTEAYTVAGSDVTDVASGSANWGSCVDIFAPGINILSTSLDGGTAVFSGSSMAGAHVAGVVARYQSSVTPAPTPLDIDTWLKAQATPDALTFNSPEQATSPNLLLYANC